MKKTTIVKIEELIKETSNIQLWDIRTNQARNTTSTYIDIFENEHSQVTLRISNHKTNGDIDNKGNFYVELVKEISLDDENGIMLPNLNNKFDEYKHLIVKFVNNEINEYNPIKTKKSNELISEVELKKHENEWAFTHTPLYLQKIKSRFDKIENNMYKIDRKKWLKYIKLLQKIDTKKLYKKLLENF